MGPLSRIATLAFLGLVIVVVGVSKASAQPPQLPGPTKEHDWLKQFVGQWDCHAASVASDNQPAMQSKGLMKSKMLGSFWVVNELDIDIAGGTFHAIQSLGYDPDKKKYVGTWIDSMVNYSWQYEGEVEVATNKLVMIAEGPNFMTDGRLTQFRDSYEFKTPDLIATTSEIKGDDGKWITFMTGEMKRSK
jgi:hypothetical protein